MSKLKLFTKKIVNLAIWHMNNISFFRYIFDQILQCSTQNYISIFHKNYLLKFLCPNSLVQYRIASFSTKEPETLDWIDSFPENSVFWDIGANIGLYSCYAAISKKCVVIAFEPSVFNLDLLAKNIFANKLTEKVCIFPLPLTNKIIKSTLNMTSSIGGGALSTFQETYGQDGLLLNKIFSFTTYGISIEQAVSIFKLQTPNFIKLDVDGIEHLILEGCGDILKKVESVLVEINDDFPIQSKNAACYLSDAGLKLSSKGHNLKSNNIKGIYNQIWRRQGMI